MLRTPQPHAYCHARHHAQATFICKDVYGGHDYLPDQLLNYSKDSGKVVLVLEDPEAEPKDNLLGIVCVERRGADAAFLFGLRVHPNRTGRGIGARLTAAAEASARTLPGVLTLQTATIAPNAAMRSILVKQAWQVQQALDMWPGSEETVRIAKESAESRNGGGGKGSVVDLIDGAAAAVSTPAALELLPQWQVCRSLPELRAAVSQALEGVEPPEVLPMAQAARCWLPFHYAPLPVDSREVETAVETGDVYILPGSSGSSNGSNSGSGSSDGNAASNGARPDSCGAADGSNSLSAAGAEPPGCRGVVIVQHNWESSASEYTHRYAGIIGSSPAVVESALLVAARTDPYFTAFVARPRDALAPALFDSTATAQRHVLVYSKDL